MVVVVVFVSLVVIVGLVGRVSWWIWWKPKMIEKEMKRQGIKGTKYRTLMGDLKDEGEAYKEAWSKPMDLNHNIVPRVLPHAHLMLQTYGKTSFKWMGTTPAVTIWEPDLLREILINKSGHFVQPQVNPLIKLLANGINTLEGEQWAQRRNMIKPAFHIDKLKEMVPTFLTSCGELIERWNKLLSDETSCELDVWPEIKNLTIDAISRTLFGNSFEEGKRIFELQKEQIVLAIEAASSIYVPGFRFLPTTKNKRRMFINNEIKRILQDIIHKKLESMKMGGNANSDILSLMLQSSNINIAEKEKNTNNSKITIDNVIEECKGFYFAGQDTTSALLTWTLILLSMHPTWQQKAREEVLRTCGKNKPNFESIKHLKIVNMILHEVLRLYPPVITQIRHTEKKTKLGDITLPAGVHVLIPTLQVHHDQEFWGEDAEEFNPERFSEGVSKASKGQNAFLPFGWGPRMCLGQAFALIEAKLGLAMVLQHFSFELSPSYAHAPSIVITLQPQFGAHLILRRL